MVVGGRDTDLSSKVDGTPVPAELGAEALLEALEEWEPDGIVVADGVAVTA
jgi:hypothetical protein